jgi:hypothetical protein
MLFVESLGAEVNGILDKNDKQSSDSDTSLTLVRDQLRYLNKHIQIVAILCYLMSVIHWISTNYMQQIAKGALNPADQSAVSTRRPVQ